jgi:hypothetical protein
MEQLLTSLANMGGLGILAAALLYLHISSIKAFREELAAERAGFLTRNTVLVDAINRQTETLADQFRRLGEQLTEFERHYYGQAK